MANQPTSTVGDKFRRHCESALTHPLTLGAVAVLLVNDLVFKALWPHPWTTGKLSDLAWMVFAPPLLAYLLSYAARGNARAQQTVFAVAYVGLALIYAAFNTFASLHDWIIAGFSLVTGGTAGSPLDPWDSLVIPISLGIALWVWRRGPLAPGGLRTRFGMVAASLAAFATVATSEYPPDPGITSVGNSPEGVVGGIYWGYLPFQSDDGGLSWTTIESPRTSGDQQNYMLGGDSVETPRGTYSIEEADIILRTSGREPKVVYSAAHLRQSSNRWLQEIENKRFEYGGETSSGPTALTFDPQSGNVIAAMGIQGVVVGKPDGSWVPAAVFSYSPTDFSLSNKVRALLSQPDFLASILIFPLSMIAAAFVAVIFFLPPRYQGPDCFIIVLIASGLTITTVLSFTLLIWVGSSDEFSGSYGLTGESMAIVYSIVAIFADLVVIMASLAEQPRPHWVAVMGAYLGMMFLAMLSLLPWLLLGWNFGLSAFFAIILCLVTTITLARHLIRRGLVLEQHGDHLP